jgi:hypothetical protein
MPSPLSASRASPTRRESRSSRGTDPGDVCKAGRAADVARIEDEYVEIEAPSICSAGSPEGGSGPARSSVAHRPQSLYVAALSTGERGMSEDTVRSALRMLGDGNDDMSAHGFRATLARQCPWHPTGWSGRCCSITLCELRRNLRCPRRNFRMIQRSDVS